MIVSQRVNRIEQDLIHGPLEAIPVSRPLLLDDRQAHQRIGFPWIIGPELQHALYCGFEIICRLRWDHNNFHPSGR